VMSEEYGNEMVVEQEKPVVETRDEPIRVEREETPRDRTKSRSRSRSHSRGRGGSSGGSGDGGHRQRNGYSIIIRNLNYRTR
jgi:hypothetical protein